MAYKKLDYGTALDDSVHANTEYCFAVKPSRTSEVACIDFGKLPLNIYSKVGEIDRASKRSLRYRFPSNMVVGILKFLWWRKNNGQVTAGRVRVTYQRIHLII